MTYQPRNRRLCMPPVVAFEIHGATFYVDDADERDGDIVPHAWGREGGVVRVVTYYGRFTLCDDRGRFLKRPAYRGESKRRVRTFRSAIIAAEHAVLYAVESCE